jgi:hypothetical protein
MNLAEEKFPKLIVFDLGKKIMRITIALYSISFLWFQGNSIITIYNFNGRIDDYPT